MSEEANQAPAGVIVLTDIVEEGLPLDQLPDLPESLAAPGGDVGFEERSEKPEAFSENGTSEFSDLDLAGLDLELEESLLREGVNGPGPESSERPGAAGEPPAEMVTKSVTEAAAEPEITGDSEALLDDNEFAEVELSDDLDLVLAGLLNAGLRRAGEANGRGAVSASPGAGSECESPDDYLVDEEGAAGPGRGEKSRQPQAGPGAEDAISASLAATIRRQVEAAGPAAASSEPQICAEEPPAPDFSRQIESLTQEWSKQLLQSTYASMDKMIQAVGDLAPTIVDRVAREIIPPLAEQVIKAEIARLEAKLESEDEADEALLPPSGPEARPDEQ